MILKNNGFLSHKILSQYGWISYSRTVLIPVDEQSRKRLLELDNSRSVFPLDQALGVDKLPFKMTYRMAASIAKEGIRSNSYVDAGISVREKHHVEVSATQIEKVTDYVGALVFREQMKQAEEARNAMVIPFDNRKRRKQIDDIMYMETDGAIVHVRDNKNGKDGWIESKHAMLFHSKDVHYFRDENGEVTGHRIGKRDFTGFIGSADDFKAHFYALARRNRAEYCSHLVVISDGAPWIHLMVKELFPKATHILDLFHAKENASKFAMAVKRGKNQKKEFADKLCKMIDEGKIEELLVELEPYKDEKMAPGIPNLYTYILNHKDCMNYPEYRAKGYFVGSGAMESANKYLMQDRMKLQGMRWKSTTGQGILSLKVKYESENWNDVLKLLFDECYKKSY